MLTRTIAQSLIALVPEKRSAVLTLLPDSASPQSINVSNAWLKPMNVSLRPYGSLQLQGDETRINIPQHELNPASNGRELRARDIIVMDGIKYRVLIATLKSIRTRWECVVRKEIS